MTMLSGAATDQSRICVLSVRSARRAVSAVRHKTVAQAAENCLFSILMRRTARASTIDMPKSDQPVTIKKYANRRLYNTGTSTYVTLEDLAVMVKKGDDFVVYDAKTGEEITRSVLAQIIFEQEAKEGQNLLPINFLRQLIRFYGNSMQMLVPRFLEASIESLTREQGKFREQMAQAFGVGNLGTVEEQVRRNMEMFQRTFAMFAPFARREAAAAEEKAERPPGEIDELKRQLNEMQKRLDRLSDKDKG
jgi:polyhydroxyalkanoate synthesis repressor PhaR